MVLIKMLAEYHGKVLKGWPRVSAGSEIEVPDEAAKTLVERGLAVYVQPAREEAPPEKTPAARAMAETVKGMEARRRRNA